MPPTIKQLGVPCQIFWALFIECGKDEKKELKKNLLHKSQVLHLCSDIVIFLSWYVQNRRNLTQIQLTEMFKQGYTRVA